MSTQESAAATLERFRQWTLAAPARFELVTSEPVADLAAFLALHQGTYPESYLRFVAQHGTVIFMDKNLAEAGDQFMILTPEDAQEHDTELMVSSAPNVDLRVFATTKHNPLDALCFDQTRKGATGEPIIVAFFEGSVEGDHGSLGFDAWLSQTVAHFIRKNGG